MRRIVPLLLAALLLAPARSSAVDWKDRLDYLLAPGYALDGYTLVNEANKLENLYLDLVAVPQPGLVTAVIEIPQGTNAKFEVTEDSGKMSWELKNGKPRVVKYLGYPANYGMIPRTISGDGDSLDVLVLGRMELRGTVLPVKVIGVFRLLDGGDVDDKILAVVPGSDLDVDSLAELDAVYPGITRIIEIWFTSYKGADAGLESGGFGDVPEAWRVIDAARAAFGG